jgi:hypothetical protein
MRKLFSTIFLLCTITVFAQGPTNISVESCTEEYEVVNGTYTKSIPNNDCDCYNKDAGEARIIYKQGTFLYESGNSCDDPFDSKAKTKLSIRKSSECNNILAGGSPDPCMIVESSPIPTLSQWTIIILSLLMVILGVKAVYQKVRINAV